MERITRNQVDTTDEICARFNQIIDNQNQIEGKLLTLISANRSGKKVPLTDAEKAAKKAEATEAKAAKKAAKAKKKGFTMLKTILAIAIFVALIFAGTANAYVATDINDDIASNHVLLAQYLRDTVGAGTFTFTPQSAPTGATVTQGLMYFDSSANTLQVSLDGSSFSTVDTAGGVSLDGAYDFGSAGGGRTILATDGAVQITNTQNDTASLLGLTYSGNTTGDGLTITMSVGSGDAIEIENTGTGADIEGTGNLWNVTKAGNATFVGATFSGDITVTGSTANIVFDVTDDELLIEDDAILSFGDAADVTFSWNATNLLVEAATDNTGQIIFGSTNAMDIVVNNDAADSTVLFDISAEALILNGWDVTINDDDVLNFGDSKEFSIEYDEDSTDNLIIVALNANDAVQIGDGTTGTDFKWLGATSGDTVLFDASGNDIDVVDIDIGLDDDAILQFGTSDDFTINFDGSGNDLNILGDGLELSFGAAGAGYDVVFHGDAGSATMTWDENANTNGALVFNNADVEMGDGDFVQFGDGADLTVSATTTTTTMTMAAGSVLTIADTDDVASLLTFGVSGGTHGLDVLFQGSTAGDIVDWDAGADTWNFGVDATGVDVVFHSDTTLKLMNWIEATSILSLDGATAMLEFRGANVDAHETTLAVVEPTKSNIVNLPDDTGELSYIAEGGTVAFGPTGAIPLTDAVVLWTSTGADAASLPDGTSPGQILSIVLVAQAGGNGTLTPDSVTGSGWATMVFTNIGESATFLYVDSTIGWLCLGTFGVTTQPLITQ